VEPTIFWGKLELSSAAGGLSCEVAGTKNVVNEPAGEADSVTTMLTRAQPCKPVGGECTSPEEIGFEAAGVIPEWGATGWPGKWVEEGPVLGEETFRGEIIKVQVNVVCYLGKEEIGSLLYVTGGPNKFGKTGSAEPRWINGTSATKPGEIVFDNMSGHLQAEAIAESPPETEVSPKVKITLGSNLIEDEGTETWGPKVTTGCRIKSAATFPNDEVETVETTKRIRMRNKRNPGKETGLATGSFSVEFKCGPLVTVPVEGTIKGALKVVGVAIAATTPLITMGSAIAP
jgi:hypothetical protein